MKVVSNQWIKNGTQICLVFFFAIIKAIFDEENGGHEKKEK